MPIRDLVVIGASAGGVQALRQIVATLPPALPAAVCVVLHIGRHASTLPELLAAVGGLPAHHATDGEPASPGHLHVAPPDRHLLLKDDRLRLYLGPRENHARPAIDPLFRSAALTAGARVIGVVLTGRNADDAGARAVQACGGTTIVQDPGEAESPEMPAAALRAGPADHVLPLAAIGPRLARLVGTDAAPGPPPPAWLVDEHEAFLAESPVIALARLGTPSTLACPDCGGPLWEVAARVGGPPLRFRCHTGHAFSAETLGQGQDEATEAALWAGVRALEEQEHLLQRLAALDREAGDAPRAVRTQARAQRAARSRQVLRALITRTVSTQPAEG